MHAVEKMMFAGQTPWHGLGTKVEPNIGINEALVASGLNWSVDLEQLQLADGRQVDRWATVRSTDRRILGTVGPKYVPLQNLEAFGWFEPFLQSKDCSLHTAGSLYGGRKVWVLAHVSGSKREIVTGDRVDLFILLSHGHDGATCLSAGFTPVRVVCANTLRMAMSDGASKLFRFLHTKGLKGNLVNLRETMDVIHGEYKATCEQYRKLASTVVNKADLRKYVKLVLDIHQDMPLDEIPARTRNLMLGIEQLAEVGTGSNIPGVKGTLWGSYNAVTEYLSHGRGAGEKKLDNLWFGSSAELNKKAFEEALAMAS